MAKTNFHFTLEISLMTTLLLQALACKRPIKQGDTFTHLRNMEAREDSVKMSRALALQAEFEIYAEADAETEAVGSSPEEDAADDPAIWRNAADPSKSLIIGTNKKTGLYVFDLDGNIRQIINVGKINNVDLRDGFMYRGNKVPIVAGSNRSNNCISLFYIDPETSLLSDSIMNIRTQIDTVYGLCMYHDARIDRFYVFVNGKGGKVEQWLIEPDESTIKPTLVRSFAVGSQPEGMVADDSGNYLYLGVEEEGIIKTRARHDSTAVLTWLPGSNAINPSIAYDIEGLALLKKNNITYLFASIQGNFSYAIFRLGKNEGYVTSFVIKNGKYDGVEETDGIEIFTGELSAQYPEGLMVVQDGFNHDGNILKGQNFKLISLTKVLGCIN